VVLIFVFDFSIGLAFGYLLILLDEKIFSSKKKTITRKNLFWFATAWGIFGVLFEILSNMIG